MTKTKYDVKNYATGETIGAANLTDEQFAHYMSMAQQPEGLIRLGAMPHDMYDLDSEHQDAGENTTIYLD
jgi:hypothetical protein